MINIKKLNLEQYSYTDLDKLYNYIGKLKSSLYQIQFRETHRKQARAYAKVYREAHKEEISAYNKKRYRLMKRSRK